MDRGWAEMTPAARLRTIRGEVRVGWFKSARENRLSRLAGQPGIAEIVRYIAAAEQSQAHAILLLEAAERAAEEVMDEAVLEDIAALGPDCDEYGSVQA